MGMASVPPPMMKLAMPVSPYPTFPRREKGQTNRYASFTLRIAGTTNAPALKSLPVLIQHSLIPFVALRNNYATSPQ
jgi:hypothetical protein